MTQRNLVSVMDLPTALEMGPEAWDRMALAHPFPSVFMSWAWHQAWLTASPESQRDSTIVFTDYVPSSSLPPTILLPLARRYVSFHRWRIPALTWCAGDVGAPDHLDVLAADPADCASVAEKLVEMPWDILLLPSLEEGFPGARALTEALETRGCRMTMERLWPCAQIHLPESWDEYLKRLSAKRRHRIRKDERDLRGSHEVKLREFDSSSIDEGWEYLARLNDARWAEGGSLANERLGAVYRCFARLLAEQGQLVLMGLEVDGSVVAIDFWARFGLTLFGLQSGWDPRWSRSSVGRVLRGIGIRRAIDSGLKTADFSRAGDPYKREWCPDQRWCFGATVFRNNWRGLLLRGWQAGAFGIRPVRAGWQRLRRWVAPFSF